MKKKKTKKVPKTGAIWKLSKEEATLAQKPHYNAYVCWKRHPRLTLNTIAPNKNAHGKRAEQ